MPQEHFDEALPPPAGCFSAKVPAADTELLGLMIRDYTYHGPRVDVIEGKYR